MIRLEALRAFVTVAECGNIREAAERLFRTQSAVSMTLKQVEDTLGAPLFERDRKNLLTELGIFVRDMATVMLRDHDAAMGLMMGHARGQIGRLRIASVPSVAALILPDVLHGLLAERPGIEIDLVDTDSADVRHLVESGQAEMGIASAADQQAGLIYEPLFEDRLMLVCCEGTALASGPALGWSDLLGQSLILNETTRGIAAPEFLALAAAARLKMRNVTSLLAMVQAGAGVTLLPGLATLQLPRGLVAVAFAAESASRQVKLIGREGRVLSPLAQAFRQGLGKVMQARSTELGLHSLWG